jgi:hypothetical protein
MKAFPVDAQHTPFFASLTDSLFLFQIQNAVKQIRRVRMLGASKTR